MQGYKATRTKQGILTVHSVPIFVTCSRGTHEFDDKWVAMAVQRARVSADEGYHPPLHIRHHDQNGRGDVRPAGYFKITGTERIKFKGQMRTAVMADLVITDPSVQEEVLMRRLPYRSVEIFDVGNPGIDSLALLDHEAPYLELPMLMVNKVEETEAAASFSRRKAANPCRQLGQEAIAFLATTKGAHVFFQQPPRGADMDEEDKKTEDEEMPTDGTDMAEDMAEEGGEEMAPDPATEGMEGGPGVIDVSQIIAMIQDGSISVADMDQICAAVDARKAQSEATQQAAQAQVPGMTPGQAGEMVQPPMPQAPVGMSKKKDANSASVQMAKALGEVRALRAKLEERDALDERNEHVRIAMQALANRPLGADLEERLYAFHREHGSEAFKAHVQSMVDTFYSIEQDPRAEFFSSPKTPAVANRYIEQGAQAVDRAAHFAREYDELRRNGHTRMSLDRYVELNMARN
jgi:DNA uptake protein ComE-like DNA-binding protein